MKLWKQRSVEISYTKIAQQSDVKISMIKISNLLPKNNITYIQLMFLNNQNAPIFLQ